MTRRLIRRAAPLCALFVGLLAARDVCATSVAHARTATDEVARASVGKLPGHASLSDVAGRSASDMWAVGQQDVWDSWRHRGVIIHWNGVSWVTVALRGDVTGAGHLRSVAVSSSGEVWAVGDGYDGLPYVAKGSVDGFDRVNVPPLRVGDWLGGIAASPGRIVAVGSRAGRAFMAVRRTDSGPPEGVWTTVGGPDGTLYGVALAGKSDGWAVGDSGTEPLIMRLSGGRWKPADVPKIKRGFLRDVHADSRKRAIAVGGVYRRDGTITPLVLWWDGTKWSRLHLPARLAESAELYAVTGDGKGTFWVSGYDPRHPARGLLLRRGGSRWTIVRTPEPAKARAVRLQAVTHAGGLTMVVGHLLDGKDRYRDLTEQVSSSPER